MNDSATSLQTMIRMEETCKNTYRPAGQLMSIITITLPLIHNIAQYPSIEKSPY